MILSGHPGHDILEGLKVPDYLAVWGMSSIMTESDKPEKQGLLPKFFDRKPAFKKKAEEYLAKMPRKQKEEDFKKFEKFVKGEVTWAEIKGYPKSMLKELARAAYWKYQTGDYRVAESLFKGLSIIDHANWYYRAALGAIYQKQKLYDQGIEEYTMALTLNEKEISSLTNRGECYLHLQNYPEALRDFETALKLDPEGKNSWGRRAKVLLKKIIDEGHGESLEEE